MKIIGLSAENVKRLVAVEIKPDGNLVQITGRNGQGKTSVLDSIWWALGGAENIQAAPIRKGADKARIRLDLGEIVVTRTFTRKDGGDTTSITVENADGAFFKTPQTLLDRLLGELAFDPLAFKRMKGVDQAAELRRFISDVDFDAIDAAHRADFDRRTDVNRRLKAARTQADAIKVPDGLPPEPIDLDAMTAELEGAGQHNADLETRKARRVEAARDLLSWQDEAKRRRGEASRLRALADETDAEAERIEAKAAAMAAKIDEAPELPDAFDTSAIVAGIREARTINAGIEQRQMRDSYSSAAERLAAEAERITALIAARQAETRVKIAAAEMPIKGLGFEDGTVMLEGVPFDQASDAEQLRASIAIAMASNPRLRVIRVRDGSLLDEDAMTILAEMADQRDYQVWIERVDGSGKVGFVLEDGRVKESA